MDKDVFAFIDEEEGKPGPSPTLVWNILTVVMLLLTLCVGGVFLTILINPYAGINPFPPPTLPPTLALDTPTPTPKRILPPTWTPTPLPVTDTPTPTETPLPTVAPATTTPEPTQEPVEMPFVLHEGNPQYIPNLYHAELGCNWMGVGGQVLSLNGAPVTGIVVRLGGQLAGQPVDMVTVSGIATKYGPAGYEFDLTSIVNGPTASTQSLWVQLLDQAGLPMSEKIYFDTFEDCDKSTIIIYFKQVK